VTERTFTEVFDELLGREPVLDDVERFLARFVAYPSEHARIAHTLWIGHAHLMDAWDSTSRIAFLSPEPGSGKTRAIEVTELLVPNPVEAVNVTPAYLFRKVGECAPTILYDEVDTVFGPKAKDNEEIRGLLNAGHRKGAVAGRCVVRGKIVETEEIPAYCAVALAGLGGLPDTLLSRSIVIRMRKRAFNERIEPFRRPREVLAGHELRDRLSSWADAIREKVTWPDMPAGVEDRDADVWEARLAVADKAGGDWPRRARCAAVTLVTESKESTPSLGVLLLRDIKTVFTDDEVMFTAELITALNNLDEAPWAAVRKGDHPLNARYLSEHLRRYGIHPGTVRMNLRTAKGYKRVDFHDAWTRYLGPPHHEPVTNVTPSQTDERGYVDELPDNWHWQWTEPDPLDSEDMGA
jgi:hypothetical protein